jgi:spore coat polysaccharide biosynthesis protein SpsF (cytidylyltransferase family)
MRGRQIVDSIFYGLDTDQKKSSKRKVCRDPELIKKRNEALIHRYYFWVQQKIRYEEVVRVLGDEFYLSTTTITKILTINVDRLLQIKKEKPTVQELKKQYPYINWAV